MNWKQWVFMIGFLWIAMWAGNVFNPYLPSFGNDWVDGFLGLGIPAGVILVLQQYFSRRRKR